MTLLIFRREGHCFPAINQSMIIGECEVTSWDESRPEKKKKKKRRNSLIQSVNFVSSHFHFNLMLSYILITRSFYSQFLSLILFHFVKPLYRHSLWIIPLFVSLAFPFLPSFLPSFLILSLPSSFASLSFPLNSFPSLLIPSLPSSFPSLLIPSLPSSFPSFPLFLSFPSLPFLNYCIFIRPIPALHYSISNIAPFR